MHATSLLATPRFSACFFGGRWGVGVVVCYFLPLCGSVWGLLLLLLSRALGVLALYLASLCHITEKNSGYARGPLPVKEIAIYYDRWEGEGLLCSLQDTERDFPSFFFPHRHLALGFVACVRTTGYVRVGSSRLSSRLGFVFGRIPGGGSKCAIAAFLRFLPTRDFSSLKPTLKS